jgi:hypothetical protein
VRIDEAIAARPVKLHGGFVSRARRCLGARVARTRPNPKHAGGGRLDPEGGVHAVLIFDRAGWHTTPNLVFPPNLTPIWLPSRAPELNPVENVWQYLRANWLSNAVFETFDDIVDAARDVWRNLTARPEVITSIGLRTWAHVGAGQPL